MVEADALNDVTDNIVEGGLSGGGDLTEDVDHTGGDGGLCGIEGSKGCQLNEVGKGTEALRNWKLKTYRKQPSHRGPP